MNQKGFTLIELIIVIMIIGILGIFTIPIFMGFRTEGDSQVEVFELSETVDQPTISNVVNTPGTVKCFGGYKVIELGGKTYWIGDEPDTWGDLKAIPCK